MISVIIPVYQVSDYIERCIRSVMAQTYTDIECVIVDDATQDDSIVKCENLIREYDGPIQFRIVHHEKNRGLSAARNTGTYAARGEYLFYLDSDDEITSNCLQVLMEVARMDDTVEMVQGNSVMKGQDYDKEAYWDKSSVHLKNNDEVREWYYKRRTLKVSMWNKLLKRDFVIGNNLFCKEGLLFEDLLWSFYLMKNLNNVVLCKEETHHYYIRPQSITTGIDKKKEAENFRIVYNEILHNLTSGKEKDELRGHLYFFCKTYMQCIKSFPEFRETLDLFINQSRVNKCWYGCIVLSMVAVISKLENPLIILGPMNNLRWKMKRLFKRTERQFCVSC